MSYYVIKNRYAIPRFIYLTVASWEIGVLGAMAVLVLASITKFNLDRLSVMPWQLATPLALLGVYAAFGCLCLYMTMWTYWVAVERSSILARLGWFLVLLLLLHIGAAIYAFFLWLRNDLVKVEGPQPLYNTKPAEPQFG